MVYFQCTSFHNITIQKSIRLIQQPLLHEFQAYAITFVSSYFLFFHDGAIKLGLRQNIEYSEILFFKLWSVTHLKLVLIEWWHDINYFGAKSSCETEILSFFQLLKVLSLPLTEKCSILKIPGKLGKAHSILKACRNLNFKLRSFFVSVPSIPVDDQVDWYVKLCHRNQKIRTDFKKALWLNHIFQSIDYSGKCGNCLQPF